MLATALVSCGKSRTLLAARGAHKSLIYAAGELDFNIEWIYPEENEHFCSCTVTPEKLRCRLSEIERPFAVYITSPDYLGKMADIPALSEVCHELGVPLLVDNAHGAYLAFSKNKQHPIRQGADMCADSAHKTLPVLTGGGYLHISHAAPKDFSQTAPDMLSAFASTSPSYLILLSLDLCNRKLSDGYGERIDSCIARVLKLKEEFSDIAVPSEPMKIVLSAAKIGYSGDELANYLREKGIEPEYADCEYVVLMPTPENSEEDFKRLGGALTSITRRKPIKILHPSFSLTDFKVPIKEAIFGASETVDVSEAVGRICSAPMAACPPAVPIVVSAELITEELVDVLQHYGIKQIKVVKEPLK